ncbi:MULTISPECIES: hypothetical protein [Halomonadaceae]|uniref:hypothetical protein n=1 Tax=Halomonadaceae TaxID=28256 RepID=UPI000DD453D8|nr:MULTISPECIES: hypothetical protein [Halomonas]
MDEVLSEYFAALDRLKRNKPIRVAKGSKITNDSVALEAGRKKGTIKKSRVIYSALIDEINQAKRKSKVPDTSSAQELREAKMLAKKYKSLWEEALQREISLLHENHELKEERALLLKGKVEKIR